jgi:hypothetical protein
MHLYNISNVKSYFIVSGCCCGPLATGLSSGCNDMTLVVTGLANRLDDPVPLVLLKIRKSNRN